MKKLITLIAIIAILSSCGYRSADFTEAVVITELGESVVDEGCYYIGRGTRTSSFFPLMPSKNFCVYDACGKFNVGDTIYLTKK